MSDKPFPAVASADNRSMPVCISDIGAAARLAWDEFFLGQLRNRHTRAAYKRAVTAFLNWVHEEGIDVRQVAPGVIGEYFDSLPGSIPTRKLHLAALRAFFNVLVNRHVIPFNPAATVRGEKYSVVEGKTTEITQDQARKLLGSFDLNRPVGCRDRAIVATLIYTTARAGAVAALRLKDLVWDGSQYAFRFTEKGGKSRLIPIRHDLQTMLFEYLSHFDWQSQPKDAPLFRSVAGRTGMLTGLPIRNIDVCRMVKRRLRDCGLSVELSPHSFRVATITNLLSQGALLEDVQHLAGHADPRTTRLYDRRKRQVTRNLVERITI